jgi:hypothetical protein
MHYTSHSPLTCSNCTRCMLFARVLNGRVPVYTLNSRRVLFNTTTQQSLSQYTNTIHRIPPGARTAVTRGHHITSMALVWKQLTAWFWADSFWLPDGSTWKVLENTDPAVYLPQIEDINWSIVFGLGLLVVRYAYER